MENERKLSWDVLEELNEAEKLGVESDGVRADSFTYDGGGMSLICC